MTIYQYGTKESIEDYKAPATIDNEMLTGGAVT